MSQPSDWPLPPDGIRFALPQSMTEYLAAHPLTQDLYPRVFGYYPSARGHSMDRGEHHDDYLLIYCVAGEGQLNIQSAQGLESYAVRGGDLVILEPGMAHDYQALDADPWSIFWVHFRGPGAGAYLAHLGYPWPGPVLRLGLLPQLLADFQRLMAARLAGSNRDANVHQALQLKALLGYCALQRRRGQDGGLGAFDLDGVHTLMQHHVRDSVTLETLAHSVGLSRHHFARVYKQMTGESPIQHFLQLKMQHACFLLEVSGRSVQSVAAELGYEDAYYFSRLFKRLVGVAPSHYRQKRIIGTAGGLAGV